MAKKRKIITTSAKDSPKGRRATTSPPFVPVALPNPAAHNHVPGGGYCDECRTPSELPDVDRYPVATIDSLVRASDTVLLWLLVIATIGLFAYKERHPHG